MPKKIIRNKNVLNIHMIIIFFIKYMLFKNALGTTILIFLNVIIFLKIEFTNFAPSPLLVNEFV